jgi:hypothetical protein
VKITLPEQDQDEGLVCPCTCRFMKRLDPPGSGGRLALRRRIGCCAKRLEEGPGSEDDR